MSSIPSATGDLFTMTGLNAYWNYTLVRDPLVEAAHTVTQFANDASSYSPNTFSNAGAGIGSFLGSTGMSAAIGWQTYNQYKNYKSGLGSFKDVYKYKGGVLGQDSIFSIRKDNTIKNLKGSYFKEGYAYHPEYLDDLKKMSKQGYLKRSGDFIKHRGWKMPLAATGVAMVGAIAAPMIFSKIGQVIDYAGSQDMNRRKHHYDSSYYNTQQYEQSAYQQVGASMEAMESKMMSVSRIYHSRG